MGMVGNKVEIVWMAQYDYNIIEIKMDGYDQILGNGEMAPQLNFAHSNEGLNLELIYTHAVDQPIQSLTVLETHLQFLLPPQQHSPNPQPSSVSGLSCKYYSMTASSAPLSFQAFLLEIQAEFVGRREAKPPSPELCLKVNRSRRKCSICQQFVKKNQMVARLRCKHVYHAQCLSHWQQRSTRCPLCRKQFQ